MPSLLDRLEDGALCRELELPRDALYPSLSPFSELVLLVPLLPLAEALRLPLELRPELVEPLGEASIPDGFVVGWLGPSLS